VPSTLSCTSRRRKGEIEAVNRGFNGWVRVAFAEEEEEERKKWDEGRVRGIMCVFF